MAMKIQVEIFCVVTLFSVAIGYQCFGGPCCLHFQGKVHDAGAVSRKGQNTCE
jgi:hypothetical protein